MGHAKDFIVEIPEILYISFSDLTQNKPYHLHRPGDCWNPFFESFVQAVVLRESYLIVQKKREEIELT